MSDKEKRASLLEKYGFAVDPKLLTSCVHRSKATGGLGSKENEYKYFDDTNQIAKNLSYFEMQMMHVTSIYVCTDLERKKITGIKISLTERDFSVENHELKTLGLEWIGSQKNCQEIVLLGDRYITQISSWGDLDHVAGMIF